MRSVCVERLLNCNVSRALRRGTSAEMSRLSSSIALLATIANTATFIGLFGTVWGIMHSFQAIGSMDSVSLSTVGPGIAEALKATSVGLFVAIPVTFGYNMFRSKLNGIENQFNNFNDLFLYRLQQNMTQQNDRVCLDNF